MRVLHDGEAALAKKALPFEEIDVGGDWTARQWLMEKAGGRRTVPQIWIGETHVGGFSELYALEVGGELDALLLQHAS